ncbi:MAG TPA: hypothetical protein ENK15_09225 [Thermopetrobacter sp.]|nr:hypothetical protein [Thermopetrobacter sp.]
MSRTLNTTGIISATLALSMLQAAGGALAGQAQDRAVRKAITKYSRLYGAPSSIKRTNASASIVITFRIGQCRQLIVFVAPNGRIGTLKSQSCFPEEPMPAPDPGNGGEGGGEGGGGGGIGLV